MHTRRHATLRMNTQWGSVRVEEKGDPTRGQDSVIDIVRPWAKSRRGSCHMGLWDSALGTGDYPCQDSGRRVWLRSRRSCALGLRRLYVEF